MPGRGPAEEPAVIREYPRCPFSPRRRCIRCRRAPKRSRRYESPGYRAKRILLGPALRTNQLVHERITKRVALAVFSSDPISSTAYATEEILLVLVFAGSAAIGLALPISVAIAGLLGILVLSYRQIIKAYSSSGGAYVVSRDNFGGLVASIAGSALIIDYILTVAVSVSAGTAALTSAFHVLEPWRVVIAVGFVVLLATCVACVSRGGSSPSPPTCTWPAWPWSCCGGSGGGPSATWAPSTTRRRRHRSWRASGRRWSRCCCS
jgi:Amino acid permease